MAKPAPQMWFSEDNKLFSTEAEADEHDKRTGMFNEISKGYDSLWRSKDTEDVVEWLLLHYDFTKRDIPADAGGAVAVP